MTAMPCCGCSAGGVVPEYVPDYDVTVWWCPTCAVLLGLPPGRP
jgi:hypothetical protein